MSAGPAQGPTSHRKQLDGAGAEGQRESAEQGVQHSSKGGNERGDIRILKTMVKLFQKQEQRTSSPCRGHLEVLRATHTRNERGTEENGTSKPLSKSRHC